MTYYPGTALRRVAAFGFDYLLIAAYMVVLTLVSVSLQSSIGRSQPGEHSPWRFDLLAFGTLVLPVILYFALSEASARQATWGKRRMGLVVITERGGRLSIAQSAWRSAAKFLPWQIAHTALFHIPGWPTAVETVPPFAAIGLGLSSALAVTYLVSLVVSRTRRTPYDILAGTRVVVTPPSRIVATAHLAAD